MSPEIEIGRLLSAGTAGFIVGCRVSQMDAPIFGGLVRASLGDGTHIFGLIYDIHIHDDGLVRQLATSENVAESVIADNRINRNVPLEISVLSVGYQQDGRIYHLLPPRPPLSLDRIVRCDPAELRSFTNVGRFGYFRHILRMVDAPVGELLAAHIQQAEAAHRQAGDSTWSQAAMQELIILLRDDYTTLMSVLGALGDALVHARL
jgi:hypothetical protein